MYIRLLAGTVTFTRRSAPMLGAQKKGRLLDFNKRPWSEVWWSWGDLNPRPKAIFAQFYMFSGLI